MDLLFLRGGGGYSFVVVNFASLIDVSGGIMAAHLGWVSRSMFTLKVSTIHSITWSGMPKGALMVAHLVLI